MLRFCVVLCFVLTNGITAKPLKPWEKVANEAVQTGWVSVDDKGMASWAVEVEPPEDMDQAGFDMDPSMKIWKRVQTGQSKPHRVAEEDLDDLQHPSTEDLLKADGENKPDALPAADGADSKHLSLGPEEDLDEIHSEMMKYLAPLLMGYKAEGDQYQVEVDSGVHGRLHLHPEQDMDDIYHKDVPEMVLYNREVYPAVEEEAWPVLRKHTEPEEDLDDIYHH